MTFIDLFSATSGVSFCISTTVIDTPIELASASVSSVFLVNNGMVKVGQIMRRRQIYWN